MLSFTKKAIKRSVKYPNINIPKPKEIVDKIKVKLFCTNCNGTGYHVNGSSISICGHCSGTGLKHYTYF